MSFDTPAGTRGARQPRAGLMVRWVNKMAASRICRTGKMMGLGFNALILTTVGARSGAQRTNPVGWFPGNEDSWTAALTRPCAVPGSRAGSGVPGAA